MKFHAQNLPSHRAAEVLALELVDRGLSVLIEWSEEKQWVVAAMGDAAPKPQSFIDPDKDAVATMFAQWSGL